MSNNPRFKRLLESARIGEMITRNRIVMPAVATSLKPEGRYGVDRHKDYYEARAKGGVGLIIIEITSVDYDVGRIRDEQLRVDDDRFIPGLSELAETIKRHGAKAALQLHHGGSVARSAVTGVQPVGPSAIVRPGYDIPRELTPAEITDIVTRFAKGAARSSKAGFDGVEINAAHRYLIAQFLSFAWNKRQDDYGGSLRNRARFLLEVIKATRELVGTNYPIWCRLNGREYGVDGFTVEEAQKVAVMLQEAGIDAINISAFPPLTPYHANDLIGSALPIYEPGSFVDLAEAVKKVVRVPVIVAGRIGPKLGERILRQRKADFIAMGRPLIADPELSNKVMSGRPGDIVPCVYCNCCMDPLPPRDCTVNAARGREREYTIKSAKQTKKVLVVGGGPAGMEAARVAALRGHQVTLYEKDHRLGGQLVLAGVLKSEYDSLTRYLATQIRQLGVKVSVGKQVTPALVDSISPDAVIVATGPTPVVPEIPGIDGDNVISAAGVQQGVSSRDKWSMLAKRTRWRRALWSVGITLLKMSRGASVVRWLPGFAVPFGRKVVVMGGGLPGLEIADFLVEKGKEVTIVEMSEGMAGGPRPMYLLMQYLLHKLAARKVDMLTNVRYEEITDKGLVVSGSNGERHLIEADTIVLALGAEPYTELADKLKGKTPEIHLAGDCIEPYGIREAIASGSRVARMV